MENVQDAGKKGAREMPRSLTVEELELNVQGGQGSWSLQGTELQRALDISRGTHKFSASQRKLVRRLLEAGGESTQKDCREQSGSSCRTKKNVCFHNQSVRHRKSQGIK